jgi:hypothetical protein
MRAALRANIMVNRESAFEKVSLAVAHCARTRAGTIKER